MRDYATHCADHCGRDLCRESTKDTQHIRLCICPCAACRSTIEQQMVQRLEAIEGGIWAALKGHYGRQIAALEHKVKALQERLP